MTSGTGGMGFNIPYTHSEERPSRTLLTKSAVAGAQSLLLFLMGRTPGAPATVEIKPTATIAWREIAYGPVRRKGKPIPLVDCPAPLPVQTAFRPGASGWQETGQALDGAYIDVGENGLFARDEFATVTALGQMEFITPEEVADYVTMELEGRATGKDTVAALDGATAGPTYRAGILREYALARLDELERQRGPAIAYEMLGPPRLTKMLFEAHLCGLLRPSVRALAGSESQQLAEEALALLERDAALRRRILSVGLPIVTPDGRCVYRGSFVVVPPPADGGDPLAAAAILRGAPGPRCHGHRGVEDRRDRAALARSAPAAPQHTGRGVVRALVCARRAVHTDEPRTHSRPRPGAVRGCDGQHRPRRSRPRSHYVVAGARLHLGGPTGAGAATTSAASSAGSATGERAGAGAPTSGARATTAPDSPSGQHAGARGGAGDG